ncbi:hypothetical protein PGTUg99_012731 [Puccinia graminis f. sp. tritici]|uniref:Expansin-like EG45 domain-containing protein n=1 Tax=Puccinia graminis f. sp. tritici TaxID=56615 RepID=A0A5B0RRW1_PUCGR|nr:hypothetical protein PGTUg99_012731 [Puccinia graminis f. sp. tritici]
MLLQLTTLSLFSICSFAAAAGPPRVGTKFPQVQGTYWNGATYEGSCLLSTYQRAPPAGLEYVAVANNLNRNGDYCGACIKVTPLQGKRAPVLAIVSTYCADCPANALDMPGTMYDRLMGNAPGRPGIGKFSWEVVPCPLKDVLPKIKNKEGSSKYSLSMLVADAKFPVQSVEINSDKRVFPAYKRDYNYWEIHNSGPPLANTVDVKVTCTNTRSFVVKNVDPSSKDPFKAANGC